VTHTHGNADFAEWVSQPRRAGDDLVAGLSAWGARALLEYPSVTASIIFTHTVTGPVAFRTLFRWMPQSTHEAAGDYLWQAFAGVFSTFTGPTALASLNFEVDEVDPDDLVRAAIDVQDEHAIKLAEAVLSEPATGGHRRQMLAAAVAVCERLSER